VSRRDELRLLDIRTAVATIREHLASGAFDRKTSDAVLYNLVVIGEAANRLSDETKAEAPEIPWPRIVGLRNLLAHEYFRVDLDVVATIVRDQLEALDCATERLLSNETR
jgi:uncharacterized protein with HEPN domain